MEAERFESMIKECQKTRWNRTTLAALIALTLIPALARAGGIDPAILAKANQGDPKGVARDMKQAADWYAKAAELGDAFAQGTVGVLYAIGQGFPRDDIEAYYWLDLAAAVNGPDQEKYVANRQNVGTRITADEIAIVQEREVRWKATHPR
jgi:hypothetical protein